ncbi:ribosomal RNA-processing protein 7 homolog A [Phymastichus coffea]|uniref:ribosomal RNA-processing protein 7 homolog A n=1 Tax=Phymastichus coffea TaxID=108790 RepID=UPI00273A794D|nr:ribosomal RNA-processing protein 7 homolog A [Phymastichus coffea]
MKLTMNVEKKKVEKFNSLWIKYDSFSSDRHQLFLKEHSIRNQDPKYPRGKTLFILNIPPYATSESIAKIFNDSCGPVHSVTFIDNQDNKNKGFQNAYIVFTRDANLNKALSLQPKHTFVLSTNDSPVLTGINKWCKNYNDSIQKEGEIKSLVENYMKKYDEKITEQLEDEKAAGETVDDEGWTTVVGRKKRGKFALARKESTIQKVKDREEKKPPKALKDFYAFQIREAKKQNLAELRKKFELDKKKLEQIKSKRKFKPF